MQQACCYYCRNIHGLFTKMEGTDYFECPHCYSLYQVCAGQTNKVHSHRVDIVSCPKCATHVPTPPPSCNNFKTISQSDPKTRSHKGINPHSNSANFSQTDTSASRKKQVSPLAHYETRSGRSNIRDFTKSVNLSSLLNDQPQDATDDMFLEVANNYSPQLDIAELYPDSYRIINAATDKYEKLLANLNRKMTELDKVIEKSRLTLNRYRENDVSQFNNLVERYNKMAAEQDELTRKYNEVADIYNRLNYRTQIVSSIGGGISLRPRQFKQPVLDSNSPKIRTLKEIKPQLTPRGSISISDDWIRSNPGTGEARINPLPKAG